MMTRKHFEAIAAIVNKNNQVVPDGPVNDDWDIGYQDSVEQFATDLADLFAQDNPNFDRARFLTACGMPGML